MYIFFALIILLTWVSLNKTLSFGLTGDDWMTLYRYIQDFPTFSSHFSLSSYINDHSTYNFADLFMGLIYKLFYFNPFPYYLISTLIRISTAISFYFAVSKATKNNLAGFLSSLLFSVMFAGIETTNWVFNMNTYVSIILFNVFIYFYTKKDNQNFFLKNIILGAILGLSFIITPNRMHGLLFVIPLIAYFKIGNIDRKSLSLYFFRLLFYYLPLVGFRVLVRSTNDTAYSSKILEHFFSIDFLKSLLINLSYSFIPENIYKYIGLSQDKTIIFGFGILLFSGIYFYRHQKSSPELSKFAILSLSFVIAFMVMHLLVFDPIIMPSSHRYLIIPGAYVMVVYALLFSLLWKSKKQIQITFAILLLSTIFFSNFFSLNNYFKELSNKGRLAKDIDTQYSYLTRQIKRPQNNAPIALLFIPDDPEFLYHSITFGIPYHLMLIDPRFGYDYQKSPFAVDNLQSLIDVLSSKDSSELKRYGFQPIKIPLENVYVFTLQNRTLTNITIQARNELKKLVPGLEDVDNQSNSQNN